MGRTVVRTVSSFRVWDLGRKEVTDVMRSVEPKARRAWCSM